MAPSSWCRRSRRMAWSKRSNGPTSTFCVGVQWHPENFWRTGEFGGLFAAVRRRRRKRADTADGRSQCHEGATIPIEVFRDPRALRRTSCPMPSSAVIDLELGIALHDGAPERRRIAGEDDVELGVAEAARHDLREDVAVVDRHLQILLLIQLRGAQARPDASSPGRRRPIRPARTSRCRGRGRCPGCRSPAPCGRTPTSRRRVSRPSRLAPTMSAWNAAMARRRSVCIVVGHAAGERALRAVRVPAADVDLHRLDADVGADQRRGRAQRACRNCCVG